MQKLAIDFVPLFKFSLHQFKKYASFIIGAILTFIVLAVVPQIYFIIRTPQDPTLQTQIISLLLTGIQVFLGLGFTKLMLFLVQDAHVTVADMFNNFRIFLSYFVASFLFGLAVSLGLFLLILPGIYIAIRFQFFPYFIIENGDSAFVALQKSFNLSQNLTLELLLFGVVVIGLNLLGVLLLGLGIVFTYPLTTMATAIIYRSLIEQSESIPASSYRIS